QEQQKRASWPRHRSMPPDHPVLVSMAKRGSIFYRRPKPPPLSPPSPPPPPPPPPALDDIIDVCGCPTPCVHETGYDPGTDTNSDSENEDDAEYEKYIAQTESQLRFRMCREMPFWNCYFTPDTQTFMLTSTLAHAEIPVTTSELPMIFALEPSEYYPPTLEIVGSIVEYLNIIYKIDTCSAIIPMDRRLPDLPEFIWRLMDGTRVDMATAIACVILLRRICRVLNHCEDAPYEAAHSLFLGVFMLASTTCVCTNTPEVFELDNIVRILDAWYQKPDLVRIKRETMVLIDYDVWISNSDLISHAENNMFDVYRVKSSYSFFLRRQAERMRLAEEEQRRIDRHKKLQASLERYMYRTPHDSLGSWNQKTVNCTEKRFLFRHLPWFTGFVGPMDATARSDYLKQFDWRQKHNPIFSPLLPQMRTRVALAPHAD
ncbi:hypothetical protein LPJ81_000511, partial [Coemansia sp. IMI 209127]